LPDARRLGQDNVVALLAGLVLAAGCAASGLNKAGENRARQTVMLTLANLAGLSGELDGFAAQVRRLSAGMMRIDIESAGGSITSISRPG
jgi:hypothetical protein